MRSIRSISRLCNYMSGGQTRDCILKNLLSSRFRTRNTQTRNFTKSYTLRSKFMKVAVLGAATKLGSSLSLFLKQSSLIDCLAIYDIENTEGIALQLNHIDARCKVNSCGTDKECLVRTLKDAKIVMIVGDKLSPKHCSQDEMLKRNAKMLFHLLPAVITYCPRSMIAIVMSPLNSLIPLATEMYKKAGVYEHNRLFGVTSVDSMRANSCIANIMCTTPECVMVPVIGGSCPKTMIPLFSQTAPCNKLTQQETSRLTHAVRSADEELSRWSEDKEIAFIATAFASARFCTSLCKALRHQSGIVECAYVRSCVVPEVTYFAGPLELGPDGIQRHLGFPPLSDYECRLLSAAIPVLTNAIAKGESLVLGAKAISSELCPQPVDVCRQALIPSCLEQSRS